MSEFLSDIIKLKEVEVQQLELEALQTQITRPSFYQTVQSQPRKIHLIGEIKRASPSLGSINLAVDLIDQAMLYEAAGVAAISVLTDESFFKGSISDLAEVAQVVKVPILCKDFIISEKQLIRARNAGASMVLLIVAALTEERLEALYRAALALNLEVLVEVHNQVELKIAEGLEAKLIGVNNRDLTSFEVSLKVSEELAVFQTRQETVYLSESGFKTPADVERIKANYHGILVGETLMRADSPKAVAASLQVER